MMKTISFVTTGATKETNQPAGNDDDDDNTRRWETQTIPPGQTHKRNKITREKKKKETACPDQRHRPAEPKTNKQKQHPHSTASNSVELPP